MKRTRSIRETKSKEGLDPLTGHDHVFHEDALKPEFEEELRKKAMEKNPALAKYLRGEKKP